MKGCGEKSSDPADPSDETALQLLDCWVVFTGKGEGTLKKW